MHKKYIILGDISRVARIFENTKRIWDGSAELRTKFSIDLEKQHANAPRFSGPLHIHGTFYLPYTKDISVKRRPNNVMSMTRPCISSLIYFIENIGSDILFDNAAAIVAITCSKFLTPDNYRAEIEITSLNKNPIQAMGKHE